MTLLYSSTTCTVRRGNGTRVVSHPECNSWAEIGLSIPSFKGHEVQIAHVIREWVQWSKTITCSHEGNAGGFLCRLLISAALFVYTIVSCDIYTVLALII